MNALYKIKLQNFEGPLDLLLFFVRKDELNIYDIPIARITKSYLEYLQLMQDLNLDIASEFILMAATLMRIKVKMMLPKDPVAEDEEEMMDPREELSRRLIEYRQFKEASKSLSELDEYWRQVYRRSYFNFDLLPQNEEEAIGLKDISFFDLLAAYKKALEKKPIPVFHNVERLNVTVEDQQKYIMNFFRDRNCYLFTELCEDMAKIEIVVTLLALLDLVKRADIAIKQASIFDDIWIYKASEFKEEEIPEAERAEIQMPPEAMGEISAIPYAETIEHSETELEKLHEKVFESTESTVSHSPEEIESEVKSYEPGAIEIPDDVAVSSEVDTESESIENVEDRSFVVETLDANQEESQGIITESASTTDPLIPKIERIAQDVPSQPDLSYDTATEEIPNEAVVQINTPLIEPSPVETDPVEEESDQSSEAVLITPPENKEVPVTGTEPIEVKIVPLAVDEPVDAERVETIVSTATEAPGVGVPSKQNENFTTKEPVSTETEAEPVQKTSGWKNFLNRIVSFVRKMFSK